MRQWKEGDVFSWSYKEVDYNNSTQYWCCSRAGVVGAIVDDKGVSRVEVKSWA